MHDPRYDAAAFVVGLQGDALQGSRERESAPVSVCFRARDREIFPIEFNTHPGHFRQRERGERSRDRTGRLRSALGETEAWFSLVDGTEAGIEKTSSRQ